MRSASRRLNMSADYNLDERVRLVNHTTFDTRSIAGAEAALLAVINDGAAMPEAFEGVFTLRVVTRPSGTKYGVLDFA